MISNPTNPTGQDELVRALQDCLDELHLWSKMADADDDSIWAVINTARKALDKATTGEAT